MSDMEIKIADSLKDRLPIEKFKPHKGSAKVHSEKQIEGIANSIKAFQFSDPIGIWGDEKLIVEGHGRYEAGKKLSMTELPYIRLDHLSEEGRAECTPCGNCSNRCGRIMIISLWIQTRTWAC